MEQIRVLYRLVVVVMCFVSLGFSVSEPDSLIKTYVSSSFSLNDDLIYSTTLKVPVVSGSQWSSLVLGSKVPVMVMFKTEWCQPCRLMNRTLNDLESEFTGRFKFYRLDADEEPNIRAHYDVRHFPTFIVFKGGEGVASVTGAKPRSVRDLVQRYV